MEQETESPYRPRFWIVILGIVILLVFLYFYQPFEVYLSDGIANIHANNVVFWFASLVGVIGYAVAHWQTFRRNMSSQAKTLEVDRLVFDTLQIGILVAVIFSAGAILQAIAMLGAHVIERGPIFDPVMGRRVLAIILLVIMAVAFYLLHAMVRAFRSGWRPKRPPAQMSPTGRAS